MLFLYPTNPLKAREPDEMYVEEYAAIAGAKFNVSLFSFEDFLGGSFRASPAPKAGDTVVYRGWMVTPAQYRDLSDGVARAGATMLTSPIQYERCHYLPGWYSMLKELTPETHFFQESDDIVGRLQSLSWESCFLKDYVKSLATGDGSFVTDITHVPEVVAKMKKYRGQIEGGICARRIEDFDQDTEERYFVCRGTAYAREGEVPEVVTTAASRVDSPFFTVDTILRRDGVTRIVELGDGQVSDRKKWTAQQLAAIFQRMP